MIPDMKGFSTQRAGVSQRTIVIISELQRYRMWKLGVRDPAVK